MARSWTQATINGWSKKPPLKQSWKQQDNLAVKIQPTGHIQFYAIINGRKEKLGKHGEEFTLKDAKNIKTIKLNDHLLGEIKETKQTINEFAHSEDFIIWSKGKRKSHEARMSALNATVIPTIGRSVALGSIQIQHINRYIAKRKALGIQHSTINWELNILSALLTQAVAQKKIRKKLKWEKLGEDRGKEKRHLTSVEAQALRESARDTTGLDKAKIKQKRHLPLFIDIGLYCGLRLSEILNLTYGNILHKGNNFENLLKSDTTISLDEQESLNVLRDTGASDYAFEVEGTGRKGTKTGQTRYVPIPPRLYIEILGYYGLQHTTLAEAEEQLANNEKEKDQAKDILHRILLGKTSTKDNKIIKEWKKNPNQNNIKPEHRNKRIFPYDSVRTAFNTARDKAGIDKNITIHSLRHSYCTDSVNAGIPLQHIKALAGHASITTTEKYLHTDHAAKFAASKKLYKYLKDKLDT